jgi:hypothetical protein
MLSNATPPEPKLKKGRKGGREKDVHMMASRG